MNIKDIPKNNSIAIFETHKIHRLYEGKKEKLYFSAIDIIAIWADKVDFTKNCLEASSNSCLIMKRHFYYE